MIPAFDPSTGALPPGNHQATLEQIRMRLGFTPRRQWLFMQWEALDIPDPETPVGSRGIGEPPVGGGCASILNALSDALGDEIFQRAPVNADTILTSLEAGRPMQHPLMAHI